MKDNYKPVRILAYRWSCPSCSFDFGALLPGNTTRCLACHVYVAPYLDVFSRKADRRNPEYRYNKDARNSGPQAQKHRNSPAFCPRVFGYNDRIRYTHTLFKVGGVEYMQKRHQVHADTRLENCSGPTKVFTVRLEEQQVAAFDAMCKESGLSRRQLLDKLITVCTKEPEFISSPHYEVY